jgi:hypothetical protein
MPGQELQLGPQIKIDLSAGLVVILGSHNDVIGNSLLLGVLNMLSPLERQR